MRRCPVIIYHITYDDGEEVPQSAPRAPRTHSLTALYHTILTRTPAHFRSPPCTILTRARKSPQPNSPLTPVPC